MVAFTQVIIMMLCLYWCHLEEKYYDQIRNLQKEHLNAINMADKWGQVYATLPPYYKGINYQYLDSGMH